MVDRVELGNEFYLSGYAPGANGSDYSQRFPTAASYAQQANAWVSALRSTFPNLRIAAVGADATGNNAPRREGWNAGVLANLAGVDALTLHPFIRVTNASATPQSLLALPYRRIQNLSANEFAAIASRGLSAWVTEFNLVDATPDLTFAGTWTHGLFIAAYAVMLAQVPTVGLIDLHNVVGDALAGVLFDSTDGFRHADSGHPVPGTAQRRVRRTASCCRPAWAPTPGTHCPSPVDRRSRAVHPVSWGWSSPEAPGARSWW